MATTFRQVWPTATAGTITKSDFTARNLWKVQSDTKGAGSSFYWTHDGSDSGTTVVSATEVPFVLVVMSDQQGANGWGLSSLRGPIHGAGSTEGKRLYFWRTELDSSRWKTTIYAGGRDEDGYVEAGSIGRRFFAYCFGG